MGEGRPEGNKGAKKGKHADAATARVQESIQHCLVDAQVRAALREEKTEARWSALMSTSAVKLDLLRTNVAAKKRNTYLAFLLGGADMLQSTDEAVKASSWTSFPRRRRPRPRRPRPRRPRTRRRRRQARPLMMPRLPAAQKPRRQAQRPRQAPRMPTPATPEAYLAA